jgi:hypothetical protein
MDAESRASKSSTTKAEARELCVSIFQVLIEENEDGGCEWRRCMRSLIHIESSSEAFTRSLAVAASFNKGCTPGNTRPDVQPHFQGCLANNAVSRGTWPTRKHRYCF